VCVRGWWFCKGGSVRSQAVGKVWCAKVRVCGACVCVCARVRVCEENECSGTMVNNRQKERLTERWSERVWQAWVERWQHARMGRLFCPENVAGNGLLPANGARLSPCKVAGGGVVGPVNAS